MAGGAPSQPIFSGGSVWMYSPVLALAIIGAVLFGLATIYLSYLTLIRYRTRYFICAVLSGIIETVGFVLRCWSIQNQSQLPPFITSLSLLVLAPLLLAASVYLLVGRLIQAVLPASHHLRFLGGLHARHTTAVFVGLDILAAVVQSAGTVVAASANWHGPRALTGVDILVAGLALQTAAFVAFVVVLARFAYVTRKKDDGHGGVHAVVRHNAPPGWQRLVVAEAVSAVLILIRCIYRLVEFAGGVTGYAFRTEWLFWVFDGFAMLVATGVFCIWHPGAYLGRDGGKAVASGDETEVSLDSAERRK
ncbi:Protein RTM1 [Madurella mycetomatis]|uniref:Protein RTM1 n=1 Tax=Madurella mycetomatis TaxID=100816 RepID=A0A150ATW0_9PEZI|nr:Protein RTM1 [Madurella mycetomatis]